MIADQDVGVQSRIKHALDDAFMGEKVRQIVHAAVADALAQATVLDALFAFLKDHGGYKQYLSDSVASVAERIESGYAANVQLRQ